MSNNDAVQPVDEKSPASKEVDQWIVKIEAEIQGYDTDEIQPTRPPTKEIPSIYGNWKCMNDFGDAMSFLPETNKWQFVSFMKRAFDLKVREFLEELQLNEDKVWRYYCGVDEKFRAENSKSFIEHLLVNSYFLIFALVTLTQKYWKPKKKFFGSPEKEDTKLKMFNEYKKLEKFICAEQLGILRYMLTMDYQIPLFVVEGVYTKHSNLSSKLNTPIHELVTTVFHFVVNPGVPKFKLHNKTITVPKDSFQHLLHIFHWSRTPQGKFHETNSGHYMNTFYIPCATFMQSYGTVFNSNAGSGFDVSFNERILLLG